MPVPLSAPLDSSENSVVLAMRGLARDIFDHALAECSIPAAFARNVRYEGTRLCIGEERYDLDSFSRVSAISIGKAGHSMAEALSTIAPIHLGGIVACPTAPQTQIVGFQYFFGGHP